MAAIKDSYDKKDMQGPFDSIGLLMEDLDK
jgi:hypothetical protein